jgi:molecular chaperone GrpE
MTTGRRQIPISNHGLAGSAGGNAADGRGDGAGGAETKPAGPGGPAAAEREKADAQMGAPTAERDTLAAERDALAAQIEALTDSRLRLQAEFDNFRKRASRESIDTHARTQCAVLSDFLPVLDNLERALDAAEHHEEGKVLDGVRMTRDMFVSLLARAGVEEIAGVGAPFDPQVHDAMLVQPSEHDEGHVVAVIERGYRQGDRILRPARVVVSAGRAGSGDTGSPTAAAGILGPHGRITTG